MQFFGQRTPPPPTPEHELNRDRRSFALRSRCTLLPVDDDDVSGPQHRVADALVVVRDGSVIYEWRDNGICAVADFEQLCEAL